MEGAGFLAAPDRSGERAKAGPRPAILSGVRKVFDELLGRPGRDPVPLVLYSRPGCHLCEVMKAQITRARLSRPYRLDEVNIDGDPELYQRWGRSIPVLSIGGRVAFKAKLDSGQFERKFERLAAEWERSRERGGAPSAAEEPQ